MPSEFGDNSRRAMVVQRSFGYPPPPETEPLQCPRCESTNTKFCYYNNYNLRQPRHFCKTCRRYWTRGGTLRPVPVGGGVRKRPGNAKRLRTSSGSSSSCSPSSSSLTSQEVTSVVMPGNSILASVGENPEEQAAAAAAHNYLMGLNEGIIAAANGGFTSLLNFQSPPGFLALGGFGFGSGLPHGYDELGNYGFGGRGIWAFPHDGDLGSGQDNNNNNDGVSEAPTGCNTWQMTTGSEDALVEFGQPELEISTIPASGKDLSIKKEALNSDFQEMI